MRSLRYKDSGVDLEKASELVSRIKLISPHIGGFGGLFPVPSGYREPVLVASTDGVGTKLKVAFMAGVHDTVGVDLVAMVVNDIVTVGAKPLFFLDYFATGKLSVDVAEDVIRGIKRGCDISGCELLGGETAELPGFYGEGEYDLAGFGVGIVERSKVIDGRDVEEGDVIVGLHSSGLHSNGYSLARKVVFELLGMGIDDRFPWGTRVGDELLRPTKIYVKSILSLLDAGIKVKAISHITGGGFFENIPRVLPSGLAARIELGSWPVPPIFEFLKEKGKIPDDEMYRVFNMGIGMVVVLSKRDEERALELLEEKGESCSRIGIVVKGRGVELV